MRAATLSYCSRASQPSIGLKLSLSSSDSIFFYVNDGAALSYSMLKTGVSLSWDRLNEEEELVKQLEIRFGNT